MSVNTTPTWKRPIRRNVPLHADGFTDVNVVDLLASTGMAQSKAEAKRMIEQNLLWLDDGMSHENISTIWERLRKIKPDAGKFWLVEKGDVICVGKTIDSAVCHRIVFT